MLCYRITGTEWSQMTATRVTDSGWYGVTVPAYRELRLGTLDPIVTEVAGHLGIPKSTVREELFR